MPYIKPNATITVFPNRSYFGYRHMEDKEVKARAGVYVIINEINKHTYVGSSFNLYNRWKNHKNELRDRKHHSPHLESAWHKYGEEAFSFTVLEYVEDKSTIRQREQYYLDIMRPAYNNSPLAGSNLGVKHTDRTKANMSANHADFSGNKNPMYGVRLEGESNPMFGRKRKDTANFNIITKKGKSWEEMYGVERAAEMKRITAEGLSLRKGKDFSVIQCDSNGEVIEIHRSAFSAAKKLNMGTVPSVSKKIRNCCKGKSTSAVGFVWKYKNTIPL